MRLRLLAILLVLFLAPPIFGQATCRLSVAGLNRARRVMGPVNAECPALFHSAPFGNWGVTSNLGTKRDGHQFQGWCHDTLVCNNIGICWTDCRDGWYEWNSCTDHELYRPPNCHLYNASDCTEQASTTGINVHGTKLVDLPAACPTDTDGDGVADQGGCTGLTRYSPGVNFMSLYELDVVTGDELVQTLYFPETPVDLTCGALGCAHAASDWVQPNGYDSPASPARVFAELATLVNWGAFLDPGQFCATANATVTSVSAASFDGSALAVDSIASAFGLGFTTDTAAAASTPLPLSLAGVAVVVTDSSGVPRPASVFYASPEQVNFHVPPLTVAGPATITVSRGDRLRWTGQAQIAKAAAGLFSANGDGRGPAAAVAVRVAADGAQTWQLTFACGAEPGSCAAVPVDLGPETEQVILLLFGTGIRGGASGVRARIGGQDMEVLYAGPQSTYVGLDQVNVRLARSLIGKGEVEIELEVEGRTANSVSIRIQ